MEKGNGVMQYQIGLIGCGNMAGAMIRGMVKSGVCPAKRIIASNRTEEKLLILQKECGIMVTTENAAAAKDADIVVLAVKPVFYPSVIAELKDVLTDEQVIVSLAPSFTLERLHALLGGSRKIVRAMPNTPALCGAGMTALSPDENVTPEEVNTLTALFKGFGKAELVEERMMDAVVAVSGSSPAYAFLFLEAMADAAVLAGMPREQAYRFAAQSLLGSAKMLLESGLHPGQLKDMVCSPGGTTIEAVKVLEQKGFRSAVIDAMCACAEKCKSM